jgi:hypothetical protein
MAILEALKQWKQYFSATSIVIRTYQQSLKYIQDSKLIEDIQHKLLIKLLGYNYIVEYKKGEENKVADALSRVKHIICNLFTSSPIPTWFTEVTQSYQEDTECKELITQLDFAPGSVPHYTFSKGILGYKHKVVIGNNTDLKQKLMHSFHNSELGGHSGESSTYQRIKLLFHWLGMKQQIIAFIKECQVCQINKPKHCKYPSLL